MKKKMKKKMKKNNLIILGLVFILLSSFVCATPREDLYDNGVFYYPLSETTTNYVDSYGNLDLTSGTVPTRASSLVTNQDYSQDFEADNSEYLNALPSELVEISNPVFSAFIDVEDTTDAGVIASSIVRETGSNDFYGWFIQHRTDNKLRMWIYDGGAVFDYWETTAIGSGVVHVFATFQNGDPLICINGVSSGSLGSDDVSTINYISGTNTRFALGDRYLYTGWTGDNFDGKIGESYLGDFVGADCTHANYLYNGGDGVDFLTLGGASGQFEIKLNDSTGNYLSNFTANITNSTATTTINTTNGTIYYPQDQIVNISLYDIVNYGWTYNDVTNTSVNTSTGSIEMMTDVSDIIKPTITFNPSNGFNAANFSLENQYDDNISLNITFADNRDLYGFLINFTRSGTSYFNFTNYTLSGTSYNYVKTINIFSWPAGTYDIEIQAYDSKTLNRTDPSTEIHNIATQYNSWYRGNYTKNEPLLFELEYGTLAISLTDDTTIFNISADLYFNNTLIINSTSVDVGSTWKINNTIGGYTAGVYNYSWIVEITQADGNKSEANITGEIEIFAFGIDDCSSYNYTTLYINIFDENTPSAALNATVEIDAEIWISSPSNSRQFYQLLEGNSTYRLCLLNPNAEFFTDMYMKYTTDDGFTHRYYLVNEGLTNVTKNVSMYNFNTTTDVSDMKITARDYDTYQYLPNIITKLQRRYPAEGVWRTVQMDESGDFGLVFFNIKEENTDYRLLFYDRSNNLLKTTEKMKFICDSGVCQLTFTISPYSQIIIAEPVEVIANYDNSTKILTVTWTDPDAGTRSVRTLVTKETITGTVDICDQTQSGAAGTVVCNVSAYSGDILLSVITDNLAADSQWINIARQKLGTVLNVLEASVWTFAIMVTVAMFGVFIGAVATIIATIIGLIIVYFIGLFNPITLTFIIIASAVGIAIGIKLRN